MIISLDGLSPGAVHHLMTQTLIPRPVAWVLTKNPDKSYNLAPFSYFNSICSDPPLVLLSVSKKPNGELKDTQLNIEDKKHFVVHIAHREMAALVTETSAELPRGESELEKAGLEVSDFPGSPLPRLKDCRIAFACTLQELKKIGHARQALIFAEVKQIYVDDGVSGLDAKGRRKVWADKVDPLARLGGAEYALLGDIINIPRPK